jgi:hypothetical protein
VPLERVLETGLYFRDPAGNLLEIADGDLWPPD